MTIQGKTSGIKSSEFALSILGMVGGVLFALFSDSQWAQIGGPILSAVCGGSYTQSRATVKRALAASEAVSNAKKHESPPEA